MYGVSFCAICAHTLQGGLKTRLFLSFDNLATVSGRSLSLSLNKIKNLNFFFHIAHLSIIDSCYIITVQA